MNTLPHAVCGVIPPHMLKRVASQTTIAASEHARATIDIAGELYGRGGRVQRILVDAWLNVGLNEAVPFCPEVRAPNAASRSLRNQRRADGGPPLSALHQPSDKQQKENTP